MEKRRADLLLVAQGLAPSRERAQALIRAGQVTANGRPVTKPAALLDDVMSELDEKRQDYILNHLKDWQVFITCCDAQSVLRLKQGKTIKIENGTISEG